MSYEVGVRGAVIASCGALGAVVTVALHRGARAHRVVLVDPGVDSGDRSAAGLDADPGAESNLFQHALLDPTRFDNPRFDDVRFDDVRFDDLRFDGARFDETRFDETRFDEATRSALTACLFDAVPDDHIWWTIMVVDPALYGTPSHRRLVGHFEAELSAIDAADQLVHELNSCLVPGEAPMTATAIGIEPEARPSSIDDSLTAADRIRRRRPVAHTGEAVSETGGTRSR